MKCTNLNWTSTEFNKWIPIYSEPHQPIEDNHHPRNIPHPSQFPLPKSITVLLSFLT